MRISKTDPIRVLLVEDQSAEVELVRDLLKSGRDSKFTVTHASRLNKAVQLLHENDFDVVLLDLGLPDSVGYITFEKARAACAGVPIIVLTNMDDETLAMSAVSAGAQDYLVKRHITSGLLQRAVRYAMERAGYEHELRLSEERYALAAQGANDALWDWNLETDDIYLSERWNEMLGYHGREGRHQKQNWLDHIHKGDRTVFKQQLDAHLGGRSDHFSREVRLYHRNGSTIWVLIRGLAVRDSRGKAKRMAGSVTDITARKQAEERLSHDAFHDALTGLPNRSLFLDRIEVVMSESRRSRRPAGALLFLDLDRFKNVNDSVGHAVGDELLMRISGRLRDLLRPADTIARLGGDEFAILLPDVRNLKSATQVAERILDTLSRQFLISGHEIFTTASIGIALNGSGYHSPGELLRDADIAMYRAKANGKARFELFDPEMHSQAVEQLQLENDLRRALDNGEFELKYQPIVSVAESALVGFESLVRWNHPARGVLPPADFIGAAEDTGLIVPLCWWTIREACRQARAWQQQFDSTPFFVSVNVSGQLFHQWDMVEQFERIFSETGVDPHLLSIEITESRLLEHVAEATEKLRTLRDLGVALQIDDFGTGYCSLSYLQKFSYDSIKIDRSFVRTIDEGNGSNAIVQTIIALGRMLNMNIIAEGVETASQLERLRELACPQVQGFWFSKPICAHDAASWLDRPVSVAQ